MMKFYYIWRYRQLILVAAILCLVLLPVTAHAFTIIGDRSGWEWSWDSLRGALCKYYGWMCSDEIT